MVDVLLTTFVGGGGPIMGDLWALKGLIEEGKIFCLLFTYKFVELMHWGGNVLHRVPFLFSCTESSNLLM